MKAGSDLCELMCSSRWAAMGMGHGAADCRCQLVYPTTYLWAFYLVLETQFDMASVATNATLRDNASVTADGGVAEAADPDEGAGSAEGAPGSLPLETSGGDAGVFTATRK